jgi:hypothetical protein
MARKFQVTSEKKFQVPSDKYQENLARLLFFGIV